MVCIRLHLCAARRVRDRPLARHRDLATPIFPRNHRALRTAHHVSRRHGHGHAVVGVTMLQNDTVGGIATDASELRISGGGEPTGRVSYSLL